MENSSQRSNNNWAVRFFTIWTGQAFSLFGSQLVQFALIWWLTQKSGSATILAVATLVGMLPQILVGPFAGAIVDRSNRRVIMIVADGGIALATLLLIFLFATGKVQVWHIYAIMAVRSLGGAFHYPAMSASTPLMVPEKYLTRISGMNQTLQGLMALVAPPAGAFLLGVLPTQGVLFIDVATAALAILPLLFIDIPQPIKHPDAAQKEKQSLLKDLQDAFVYIRNWPGMVTILFMALFLNFLLTPLGSLMPLLVTKYFGKGALEFGFMESASGFGIIAGGLLLSTWGGFNRKIVTSLCGIIGIGIGTSLIGFAPSTIFPMAIAGSIISGAMIPMANGPLGALLQSVIRRDMQGRVMALVNSAATAISPIGLLIAGPLSDSIGIRTWYWFAGIFTILMAISGFLIPAVMTVETNHNDMQTSASVSTIE